MNISLLEHGIQNAQSGRDLEQSFHRYIAASLDFIEQKAFLIAFDDIDTDFSKGWPVLEMIRKYLTTPQLITVLSGDLQLYSTLVEKQQWENLGLGFDTDKEKQKPFLSMIEKLVDQYLLKILRTPNRIELKTIGYYATNPSTPVHIISQDNKESLPIQNILKQICTDILCIQRKSIIDTTIGQLMEMPTRTIVSTLSSIEKHTDSTWKIDDQVKRDRAILALSDIFLSWLQKIGYNRYDFEQTDTQQIISNPIDKIFKSSLGPDAADFSFDYTEQNKNNAFYVLGAFISNTMAKHPAAYFDYMLKIALTSNTMSEINNYDLKITHENLNNTYAKTNFYINHLGLLKKETNLNIAKKYISFVWNKSLSKQGSLAFGNGTLQLSSQNSVSSDIENIKNNFYTGTPPAPLRNFINARDPKLVPSSRTIGIYYNTPTFLYQNIDSWHKYFVMLPVSNNRLRNEINIHFSIFNLIGAIADLSEYDDIHHTLNVCSLIRDYPVYSFSNPATDTTSRDLVGSDNEEELDESVPASENSSIPNEIYSLILNWKKLIPVQNGTPCHASTITKAWTRFSFQ